MAPKVLAGAVDTELGRYVLEVAAAEAGRRGGDLLVVGHLEPPRSERSIEVYDAARRDRITEVERFVSSVSTPAGLGVEVHVPRGASQPSDSILMVANVHAVDLIVIGLRQRSRVGKMLMGSNAQDILLRARCPVLAVPPQDRSAT